MAHLGVNALADADFWAGRRVFVTGHTGFKGGWLCHWLTDMGAETTGLALDPPTEPSFYAATNLRGRLAGDLRADIRDLPSLRAALERTQPEIVFHLAAQPLVRSSYADPVTTFETNVMGTVNVLEAVRHLDGVAAVVNVTTDKCYENREWVWPYRENDPLGGFDPYSASKAGSEIVTASYRQAFFAGGPALASARAGNVLGGGDWSMDRLVPDVIRAIEARDEVLIRSPRAVRPWQHVLEPLSGYLALAQALCTEGSEFAEAWNFGPEEADALSVGQIMTMLVELEPARFRWTLDDRTMPHEAGLLMLSSAKARARLGWRPHWRLPEALRHSLDWYRAMEAGEDMAQVSSRQITAYGAAA